MTDDKFEIEIPTKFEFNFPPDTTDTSMDEPHNARDYIAASLREKYYKTDTVVDVFVDEEVKYKCAKYGENYYKALSKLSEEFRDANIGSARIPSMHAFSICMESMAFPPRRHVTPPSGSTYDFEAGQARLHEFLSREHHTLDAFVSPKAKAECAESTIKYVTASEKLNMDFRDAYSGLAVIFPLDNKVFDSCMERTALTSRTLRAPTSRGNER